MGTSTFTRTNNFPGGVTNVDAFKPFGDMPILDPSKVLQYFNDFHSYAAADWVVTEIGTGSQATASELGGVLLITTGATSANAGYLQWAGGAGAARENFKFQSGKRAWFKARVKLGVATSGAFVLGLQVTDTTPGAVSDGVFFTKAAGTGVLSANLYTGSAGAATVLTGTMVDATYTELAFYYDGAKYIKFYQDDVEIGRILIANVPLTQTLTLSFGLSTGAAVARVLSLDYLFAAMER